MNLNLRSVLEEDFDGCIGTSMKKETRVKISSLLVRVRRKMNTGSRVEGIRKSFEETCLPDHAMHSHLKEFLDLHPETKEESPQPVAPLSPGARLLKWSPDKHKFMCPRGCGHGYASMESKSWRTHPKSCWLQRATPMTPVRSQTLHELNSPWAVDFVGEATDLHGNKSATVHHYFNVHN